MSSKKTSRAAAQARAAEMRAAQARKEKQQKQILAAVTAAVVVLIAFGVFLAVSKSKGGKGGSQTLSAAEVAKQVTSVPASAFDAAGAPDNAATSGSVPTKVPDGKVQMKDGKPRVVYVGALFCPYCGTHRWATVAALSRFGTFTGLEQHRSGESNIPTFSFKNAKYTSQYVAFDAYETKDDQGQPIAELPADVKGWFDKYNAPPFQQGKGSIPWTFYGTHQQAGGPGPTEALAAEGEDDAWSKIVKEMQTGQGTFGKGIDAEANMMTAQICTLTKGQPANVCSSKGVTAAAKMLQK